MERSTQNFRQTEKRPSKAINNLKGGFHKRAHQEDKPTPLAISVANRGNKVKPKISIFKIKVRRERRFLVRLGNSPFRKAIAQKM